MRHRVEIYEMHRPPSPPIRRLGWFIGIACLLLSVVATSYRAPVLIPLSLLGLALAAFLLTEGRNAYLRWFRDA